MKRGLAAFAVIVIGLSSSSAFADTFTSVEGLVRDKTGNLSSFDAPVVERILVAERVAPETYLMDVSVKDGNVSYRIPLKVRIDSKTRAAKLLWSPDRAYLSGLKNLVKAKALVPMDGARKLTEEARLPAFGVVVTPKRIVTMFGPVRESADDGTNVSMGGFVIPGELIAHSNRWVKEVLMDDPGPAFTDFYISSQTSWNRATEVQFGVAMSGLDLMGWVGRSEDGLVSVTSRAPVGAKESNPPPKTVVVLSISDGKTSVRYATNDGVVSEEKSCTNPKKDCVAAITPILKTVSAAFPKTERFMFAASGKLTADQVLPFLATGLSFPQAVVYRSMVATVGGE